MTQFRQVSVSAPGKAFWLGEYAVLRGGPAVVAAVDRRVRAVYHTGDQPLCLEIAGGDAEACRLVEDGGALVANVAPEGQLVHHVLRAAQVERSPVAATGLLRIDSRELSRERKLGLGSSGAVAVATAAIVAAWSEDGAEPELSAVERLALAGHTAFQAGRGSGADVRASAHGGVLAVTKSFVRARRATGGEPLRVAYIWTGVSADTRAFLRRIDAWCAEAPAESTRIFDRLATASEQGAEALFGAEDVDAWLYAVEEFRAAEGALAESASLPIFTDPVRAALDAAEEAGWTAKPSGAGGGDLCVAFAGPEGSRDALAASVRAREMELISLSTTATGVTWIER